MMAYIGSKISLISKSDIRYVGILCEINQADTTVALQDVRSFGTEGRRGNPAEELPPSDEIYPYVVFRGADVKDLHVMTAPAKAAGPPKVPNDPAVVGTSRPQPPAGPMPAPSRPPPFGPPGFSGGFGGAPGPMGQPGFPGMPPQGPYGMNPPINFPYAPIQQQRQEPFQQPPVGLWPGQSDGPGLPNVFPGGLVPPHMGGHPQQQQQHFEQQHPPQQIPPQQPFSGQSSHPPEPENVPAPAGAKDVAGLVRTLDQLDLNEAVVPSTVNEAGSEPKVTEQKEERAGEAAPRVERKASRSSARRSQQAEGSSTSTKRLSGGPIPKDETKTENKEETKPLLENAAAMGTQHVAQPKPETGATVNGTSNRDVNGRLPGTGAHLIHSSQRRGRGRGGRGGYNGGHRGNRIPVPDSDFDFESANAKFNKTELAQAAGPGEGSSTDDLPAPEGNSTPNDEVDDEQGNFYQKSSFFDNISCEARDRAEGDGRGNRRARQYEERRLNLETFGQMGVDNRGYRRGGYGGRAGYNRGGYGYGGGYRRRGGYGGYNQAYGNRDGGYGGNRDGGYGNRERRGSRDSGYQNRENVYGRRESQPQQQQ